MDFAKFLRTPFYRTPLVAASVKASKNLKICRINRFLSQYSSLLHTNGSLFVNVLETIDKVVRDGVL